MVLACPNFTIAGNAQFRTWKTLDDNNGESFHGARKQNQTTQLASELNNEHKSNVKNCKRCMN